MWVYDTPQRVWLDKNKGHWVAYLEAEEKRLNFRVFVQVQTHLRWTENILSLRKKERGEMINEYLCSWKTEWFKKEKEKKKKTFESKTGKEK